MKPKHTITIEADSADLFYLAKLVRRHIDKARRTYDKPQNVERRAELEAEGRGDLAILMIDKHERLWEQLRESAVAAQHADAASDRPDG